MKRLFSQLAVSLAMLFLCAGSIGAAERRSLLTGLPDEATRLQRIDRLPPANRMRLAIGLPLRNRTTLTNSMRQLYDRSSTNFHRFLTPEQFTEKYGPTEQQYQSVINFAHSNRLEVVNTFGNRLVLDVEGSVSDIETAFHVTLGKYPHPTENRQFYAADPAPSVDSDLPIIYVSGLDNYVGPPVRPHRLAPSDQSPINGAANGSGTKGNYMGYDFRNAYALGVTNTGAGQVVGLVEPFSEGYTPGDITQYESLAGLPNVPLHNILTDGVLHPAGLQDDEVSLDIEMVISMAPGLEELQIVEGSNDVDIMTAMAYPANGVKLANQMSSSWGVTSGDTNVQPQLMEMEMQGQSFLCFSGDGGSPKGGTNSSPQNDNFLTMVGGTELAMTNGSTTWLSEVVWDFFTAPGQSAGGASYGAVVTSLPLPDYQQSVNMSENGGSTSHRNIPDVAMVADYIEDIYTFVFTNGNPPKTGQIVTGGGGTSASSPLWAGFIALVNEQAATQGKPTMGFLNPAIYDIAQGPLYAACFHDITNGNNFSSNNLSQYVATPGYNLCDGWGSPTGAPLINALVGLSGPIFVDFNYTGTAQDGTYFAPFKTLAQGTNAVTPGGTIFIKSAGSTSATMTISKPMTITASDGPAVIGP
jgi:subtilase family serine protease